MKPENNPTGSIANTRIEGRSECNRVDHLTASPGLLHGDAHGKVPRLTEQGDSAPDAAAHQTPKFLTGNKYGIFERDYEAEVKSQNSVASGMNYN